MTPQGFFSFYSSSPTVRMTFSMGNQRISPSRTATFMSQNTILCIILHTPVRTAETRQKYPGTSVTRHSCRAIQYSALFCIPPVRTAETQHKCPDTSVTRHSCRAIRYSALFCIPRCAGLGRDINVAVQVRTAPIHRFHHRRICKTTIPQPTQPEKEPKKLGFTTLICLFSKQPDRFTNRQPIAHGWFASVLRAGFSRFIRGSTSAKQLIPQHHEANHGQ